MPPDLALLSTFIGSNYPCLELIFMVPKVFEPLKFDCTWILRKECRRKKPWITRDVLDLCDERRDFEKRQCKEEGAQEYRKDNKVVQKALKKANED